jgi:cell wall-associated NlpC family hydrolase
VLSRSLIREITRSLVGAVVCGILLAPGVCAADPTPSPSSPRQALSVQVTQARQQLEVVVEEYDATTVRMADTRSRRAAVTASLVPLRQAIEVREAAIGELAAGLYMHGGTVAAALLGAPSTGVLLDQLSIVDYQVNQEHRQVLALQVSQARYQSRADELDQLASQQAGQHVALRARRDSIRTQIAALERLRAIAPDAWHSPPPIEPAPVYATGPAGTAVRFALAQLGKGYRWAADGPGTYDCSGLTLAAWRAAGVALPHNAAMQWRAVAHIARGQLRPGDLIFYYSDIHHVALYIGAGRMVHAPTYGLDVRVASMDMAPIYGYGRV